MDAFFILKKYMWGWKYISSKFSVIAHTVEYLTQFSTIICSVTPNVFLLDLESLQVLKAPWLFASVCTSFSLSFHTVIVNIIPVIKDVNEMDSCPLFCI